MSESVVRSVAMMGTVVTIQVVGNGATPQQQRERSARIDGAFEWFRAIEECCTRFDETSELRRLCARAGEAIPVSEMLFQVLQFALALAEDTDGAFDPTIGNELVARGSGGWVGAAALTAPPTGDDLAERSRRAAKPTHPPRPSYRDIIVDDTARTVTLRHPLLLDFGAIAKGLAVDAAARELLPCEDFVIDAGGDLYLGGSNTQGEPWSVGIRHPRDPSVLIESIHVSNVAVCTSGDYDPKSRTADGGHHILDPRSDSAASATALASVTVIAPSAMVADALGTAAFVLGPIEGLQLLERHGVRGIMYTPELQRFETRQ